MLPFEKGFKPDFTELNKLEEYLKENNIEYERIDEIGNPFMPFMNKHQICVPCFDVKRRRWDVICHYGSYGYTEGLLEIMGNIVNQEEVGDSVEGYLTAEQVIERIEKYDKVINRRGN